MTDTNPFKFSPPPVHAKRQQQMYNLILEYARRKGIDRIVEMNGKWWIYTRNAPNRKALRYWYDMDCVVLNPNKDLQTAKAYARRVKEAVENRSFVELPKQDICVRRSDGKKHGNVAKHGEHVEFAQETAFTKAGTVGVKFSTKKQSFGWRPPCMFSFAPVIILVQWNRAKTTRTYYDYRNLEEALQGLCTWYENQLRSSQPHLSYISYEARDLLFYLQELEELACLIYDSQEGKYVPYNKDWIKTKLLGFLRKRASKASQ
eukprot:jgi/Galph1/2237/GphlegSOOS_G873.1